MSIITVDSGALRARIDDENPSPSGLRFNNVDEALSRLRAELEDYSRRQARGAVWVRRFVPTGLRRLDAVLPHGGLPCGAVTEILAHGYGVGSMALAMRIAVREAGPEDRRKIVVVDTRGDFYPPAAWQHGLAPDRLIVIRPVNAKEAFWAVDQSLRSSAVASVIAPLSRLDGRLSRRLQLAAESSGSIGLILRSARRDVPSFAAVRMFLEGVSDQQLSIGDSHWCRITLLRVREGMPAEPVLVDLHHETGALPLPALPVDRPAAKRA